MASLKSVFEEYFQIVPADTTALRDAVFRLRYQIYCMETGFENPDDFPDGLEKDAFDDRAVHSLLQHKLSGDYVGTVRLVLADPRDKSKPFPVERHTLIESAQHRQMMQHTPREGIAEISRIAIAASFRRRGGEAAPDGVNGVNAEDPFRAENGRRFPHVVLGLYLAAVQMSVAHDVHYWYGLMEPAFARLLQRCGIHFREIGPLVDHHGLRKPYFGVADEIMAGIYRERRDIWDLLADEGRLWPTPTPVGPSRSSRSVQEDDAHYL